MSTPVVVFNLFVDVASVVNILKTTTHNGFPVVELFGEEEIAGNHGQFKGLITREQLIILLIKQVYKDDNHASNHIVGAININDFRDLYPRHPSIESVNVPQEHLHMKIDLRPFINLSPYTCCETVSFQRLFNLFRSMGLRHIVIVNENNKVVGIVTRKDLAQFRVWRKQGTAGVEELTIGDGSFPGSCD